MIEVIPGKKTFAACVVMALFGVVVMVAPPPVGTIGNPMKVVTVILGGVAILLAFGIAALRIGIAYEADRVIKRLS